MIQEIVIQHVQPEQRDEYVKVFGDILTKANYAGSHGIKFFQHRRSEPGDSLDRVGQRRGAHPTPRHADAQRHARSDSKISNRQKRRSAFFDARG